MPEPFDNYEPSEADLDMVIEKATGKPVMPASLADGIASMRQRIAQLEAEKAKLHGRLETATSALNNLLISLNKDLTVASERLTHYQWQMKNRIDRLFPVFQVARGTIRGGGRGLN